MAVAHRPCAVDNEAMGLNANFTHIHVVLFDGLEEAAAFVAALSRYLSSPARPVPAAASAVVWAKVRPGNEGVEVYLSDGALAATATGFAPPPPSGTRLVTDVVASALPLVDATTG